MFDHFQPTFTCSKSTVEILEQGFFMFKGDDKGVFIVNFENISHLVLVFLLLTLSLQLPVGLFK